MLNFERHLPKRAIDDTAGRTSEPGHDGMIEARKTELHATITQVERTLGEIVSVLDRFAAAGQSEVVLEERRQMESIKSRLTEVRVWVNLDQLDQAERALPDLNDEVQDLFINLPHYH